MSRLALLAVAVLLSGCATFQAGNSRRELSVENQWVRPTAKKEFFGFRRMNRMSPLIHDTMIEA